MVGSKKTTLYLPMLRWVHFWKTWAMSLHSRIEFSYCVFSCLSLTYYSFMWLSVCDSKASYAALTYFMPRLGREGLAGHASQSSLGSREPHFPWGLLCCSLLVSFEGQSLPWGVGTLWELCPKPHPRCHLILALGTLSFILDSAMHLQGLLALKFRAGY